MVKLSDSTRRLVTFLLIVIVGSALLIFDIPILYLLFAMLFIALIFALFTGMLILSEIISNLREYFKEYRAKIKAQPAKDRSEKKKEKEEKSTKEKSTKEKSTKEKGAGLFGRFRSKDDKKKGKPSKVDKDNVGGPSEGSTQDAPSAKTKISDTGDLNLDDFELDLDLDAELEGLEPEIGEVRTPYAAEDPMGGLSSGRAASNLDIATDDEVEDITIDDSLGDDDDIDSIYASSMDIGENEGEDILSNMEGGISAGDLAAYNSSDDSPYDYGGDDGNEEQYEAGGSAGRGMDDDDLLASLKSDIDDLKKKDDNVLLRDLKNLKFTAQELVDELNEIVEIITKSKKR